jgi:hypothetical protein
MSSQSESNSLRWQAATSTKASEIFSRAIQLRVVRASQARHECADGELSPHDTLQGEQKSRNEIKIINFSPYKQQLELNS